MHELFGCLNCIHNAGQSLNVGSGQGYCLRHMLLIDEPGDTTCKYQHRKDLPNFVVDESRSEHAAEFAGGVDGQRALVHSCLTRRYLDHCDNWTSSYRMVLSWEELR